MTSEVFQALSVPPEEADITADVLTDADLRGVHSHGSMRLNVYPERIRAGGVAASTVTEILHDGVATALVSGGNGLGQVVAHRCMDLAIAKAKSAGVALVGARHSNHFGPAAYYAEMATKAGMIGLVTTVSSVNVMAPAGGTEKLLGNNPLAIGAPWKTNHPLLLDMALSVAAVGRIKLAAYAHEAIPEGWALDSEGRTTTDPHAALEGLANPVGGYKGSGLAVMLAVIAGVLTGGATGSAVRDIFRDLTIPQNTGHAFLAVDIGRFLPVDWFQARLADFVGELKRSRRAADTDEILMPGERESRLREERIRSGIPMNREVLKQINGVATQLGVQPVVSAVGGAQNA